MATLSVSHTPTASWEITCICCPHGHRGCRCRPSINSGHVVVVKQSVTAAKRRRSMQPEPPALTDDMAEAQYKRASRQAGGNASCKALVFGPSMTAARATKAWASFLGVGQCRPKPTVTTSLRRHGVPGCSPRETDREGIQPSQTNSVASIPGHQVWCLNMINSNTIAILNDRYHRPLHRPLPTVTPATKPV